VQGGGENKFKQPLAYDKVTFENLGPGIRRDRFSGSCRIPRNVQFQNEITKPLDTTFKQCYEAVTYNEQI